MIGGFDISLPLLLKSEGGFVDNPKDPGGPTSLGVTLSRWSQWTGRDVTVDEMRALTPDLVAPLYDREYWDALSCDQLPAGVDYLAFDGAVNQGPGRTARWLQLAASVNPDGHIGPVTLSAVKTQGAVNILSRLYNRRWLAYRQDPHFDDFGCGWHNRLERVLTQAEAMAAGQTVAA